MTHDETEAFGRTYLGKLFYLYEFSHAKVLVQMMANENWKDPKFAEHYAVLWASASEARNELLRMLMAKAT